jgi:hypothetical protein
MSQRFTIPVLTQSLLVCSINIKAIVVVIFGGFLGIFFSFMAIFWAKNPGICKRKFFNFLK